MDTIGDLIDCLTSDYPRTLRIVSGELKIELKEGLFVTLILSAKLKELKDCPICGEK